METATKYMISAAGVLITILFGIISSFFWNKVKLQDQAISELQKGQKDLIDKMNTGETTTLLRYEQLSKELGAAVLDIKTTIQANELDREKFFIRKEDCILHKSEIENRFNRLEKQL